MPIKDLQPKQGNVDITAAVVDKETPRTWEKFGKQGRVCNARLKDDTGEIKLTLWNDEIDQVNKGDTIRITNGFVNEWQGEMQLTAGRFGKIEIIEKGKPQAESKQEDKPESDEPESDEEVSVDEEDVI
ncbi:MAG TPA: OB-fold nucleic acid binding domain-containing protein [Candidatus Nanoarchaeia archaeon]|nr:OB-fold nucleic acid binding domain-containing protein [Candidatus Nanoarchaeia archaeon]